MANEQHILINLTSTEIWQIVLVLVTAIYTLLKVIVGQERQRINLLITSVEERMESKVLSHQLLMDEKFNRLLENMQRISQELNGSTSQMHELNNQLSIFSTKLEYLNKNVKE